MTKTPEELTSDWKAGKLERGLYWVRFKGKIVIAECTVFGNVSKPFEIEIKTDFMIKISKVLAPVPSYDHFVELTEKIKTLSSENERLLNLQAVKNKEIEELESDSLAKKEGEEIVAELTNENNNLRGLLRECKPYLSYKINKDKHVGFTPNAANLLTRINATIGESEE